MNTNAQFRGHPGAALVDCDGVLLNWLSAFESYISDRLDREIDFSRITDRNLWVALGISRDAHDKLISDFNGGDGGFFRDLPPVPGAREGLERAHEQGREIHVITSCSSDPRVVEMRRENLVTAFGDIFTQVHCLDLHVSKAGLLAEYHPGVWVEDHYGHACTGADLGHQAHVLRWSHNACNEPDSHPRVRWVDSWDEIMPAAA